MSERIPSLDAISLFSALSCSRCFNKLKMSVTKAAATRICACMDVDIKSLIIIGPPSYQYGETGRIVCRLPPTSSRVEQSAA